MNITDEQLKVIFGKATWVRTVPLESEMGTMMWRPTTWRKYQQRLEESRPGDRTTWAWHFSDPDKDILASPQDQNAVMGALREAGLTPVVVINNSMVGGNDAAFVVISEDETDKFYQLKARHGALESKM